MKVINMGNIAEAYTCDDLPAMGIVIEATLDELERLPNLVYKEVAISAMPRRNCDRPECATTKAAADVWRKEDGGRTAYYAWLLAPATEHLRGELKDFINATDTETTQTTNTERTNT